MIEPARTAFILIDMQMGFTDPASPLYIAGAAASVPACARALEAARAGQAKAVFHVRRAYAADGSDVEAVRYAAWAAGGRPLSPADPESLMPPADLAEHAGERVIAKPSFSAFFRTDLDRLLRTGGFTSVVLAGTTTPNCIRSTAYDALELGYNVVVIEDATSSRTPLAQAANIEDMTAVGIQTITSEYYAEGALATLHDIEAEAAAAVTTEREDREETRGGSSRNASTEGVSTWDGTRQGGSSQGISAGVSHFQEDSGKSALSGTWDAPSAHPSHAPSEKGSTSGEPSPIPAGKQDASPEAPSHAETPHRDEAEATLVPSGKAETSPDMPSRPTPAPLDPTLLATPATPVPRLERIETVSTGWINKYLLHYRMPDGRPYVYESVSRKGPKAYGRAMARLGESGTAQADAVCIVPIIGDKVLLIREFRYPLNSWCISFPAGLVEPGENFERAINRELAEETGYQVRTDIDHALRALPQPGFSSTGLAEESVQVVLAQVEPAGDAAPEPAELIEPFTLEIGQIRTFLDANALPIGTRCQLILEMLADNA